MDDIKIITLYNERNESAITESNQKYGNFCYVIAFNILNDNSDSEECVNDTWYRAWNTIPPEQPASLKGFFGKITRNLALDKYKFNRRQKRGSGETELAWEELKTEDISNPVEKELLLKELGEQISLFLNKISERDRNIFISRYYFVYPVSEISERFGLNEKYVSNILSRTRKRLLKFLAERGYEI